MRTNRCLRRRPCGSDGFTGTMDLADRVQSRHGIIKGVWDFFETIDYYEVKPRQDHFVSKGFALADAGNSNWIPRTGPRRPQCWLPPRTRPGHASICRWPKRPMEAETRGSTSSRSSEATDEQAGPTGDSPWPRTPRARFAGSASAKLSVLLP